MDKCMYSKILQSIKSDDLVSFSQLYNSAEYLRFGRFPVLSLCYLYSSKKILKKFEKRLISIKTYFVVSEPFEIYQKFKSIAGRALRLYCNDDCIIYPIEMLALLHRDANVKKMFKFYYKNGLICNNLKVLYQNIFGQSVNINNDKIKISSRTFSFSERKPYKIGIFTSLSFVLLSVFCMVIQGLTTGIGTTWSVSQINNQSQFASALLSGGSFVLNSDVEIATDFSNVSFMGHINGNNHTIFVKTIQSVALIENNFGKIENLSIVYSAIDTQIDKSLSLFVGKNYGVLNNVNIICNQLDISVTKTSEADIYINGVATNNDGYIKNCTVTINANVNTSSDGECYVSGIAGTNKGTISGCKITESSCIYGAEADISGVVCYNEHTGNVSSCTNNASLVQNSSVDGWSPNVSGVVQTNYGSITNCYNFGTLKVESINDKQSTTAGVYVGGIGAINYGTIEHCLNKGKLVANTKTLTIYCGGITAYSLYWIKEQQTLFPIIKSCGSDSEISVFSEHENAFCFVGGISGFLWGEIVDNYSLSTYTTGYDNTKNFVGTCLGSSYLQYQIFNQTICISASNNYVLAQSNAEFQLGALINNSAIVMKGQDSPVLNGEKLITTLATREQIIEREVYWDEQN